MNNLLSAVTILLVLFDSAICYKWVSLKSGDPAPENVILIKARGRRSDTSFVGRIKYLNTVQVAEIYQPYGSNILHGFFIIYSNKIFRHEFEVLVASREYECKWTRFDKKNVPENIVRGGTAWNLEPVFIGKKSQDLFNGDELASIFLSSNKVQSSVQSSSLYTYALICDDNHQWVDATSMSVPKTSVSTREFEDHYTKYVARLLGPVSFVPGVVIPGTNSTQVNYNGIQIKSFNVQVLAESQKYKWQYMSGYGIPEHAVVCGLTEDGELIYISRDGMDQSVYPISFSKMLGSAYDFLVKISD